MQFVVEIKIQWVFCLVFSFFFWNKIISSNQKPNFKLHLIDIITTLAIFNTLKSLKELNLTSDGVFFTLILIMIKIKIIIKTGGHIQLPPPTSELRLGRKKTLHSYIHFWDTLQMVFANNVIQTVFCIAEYGFCEWINTQTLA